MMISRYFLIFSFMFITTSSAFAGVNDAIEERGQYWQRIHTSSALYLRGPKAQQMLNRDIARCVTELRELERLGAVRNAIPADAEGYVMSSREEAELAGWDTPERDDELFAEHGDYVDFEGCMMAKGWQRIKYVPFDVSGQAAENYKRTHAQTRASSQARKKMSNTSSDYDHLNE